MAEIKVRGQTLVVDVRAELEQFNWTKPRWSSDKLIAASPFRYDSTPSFFVRLESYADYPAGTWADSGYYDEEWKSGGIVKLLAFLRNETYEEAEEYLLAHYGVPELSDQITMVRPRLKLRTQPNYLPHSYLANYSSDYSYLLSRGIDVQTQQDAGIGYDAKSRAVVIPWYDANKRLCNVKFRTVYGKTFWYAKGAQPIRELVYGMEAVNGPEAVLEEAEIDALSWRSVDVNAIAVGGATFTDEKADIIKRSPIEVLYVSGDNDKAGHKFVTQVTGKLRGFVELRRIAKPQRFKDTNEALVEGVNIQEFLETSTRVDKIFGNITKFTV